MEMTDRWGNHGSCGLPGCVRAAHRRQQKLQPQESSLKRYFLSMLFCIEMYTFSTVSHYIYKKIPKPYC